jgi:hypothetical protein
MSIKEIFSEPDGKISFARVSTALLIVCAIGWITYIVAIKYVFPELGGLAALLGTLYGANQLSKAIGNIGGKKDDDNKAPKE